MAEEIEEIEEKPKSKRTRRKKPEPVEVEQVEEAAEPVEVEAPEAPEAPETDSKADEGPKLIGYRARVTAALLNVRERPTKASKPMRTIGAGTIVQIVREENGWGMTVDGYVMLDYIERIDD